MVKKKEYKVEHVVTIEWVRMILGMFLIGILLLVGAFFLGNYLITTDCCKAGSECGFASGLGLVILWILEAAICIVGLVCIIGVFIDDDGPEIKKEIKDDKQKGDEQ